MPEPNPQESDAVLGGQNPPPIDAAVLGGKIVRKQQLQHEKAIARENKIWHKFKYLHGFSQYLVFETNTEIVNLDVSQNFISDEFITEKLPQFKLNCELITKGQRQVDPYDSYGNEINERECRYCVVAE
jgi:uncharacterized protein (DUF2164 family)